MIQFSLATMLELADKDILSYERIAELMCHNPARLFHINDRGFIRKGYKADLTIVKTASPWKVTNDSFKANVNGVPWKIMSSTTAY